MDIEKTSDGSHTLYLPELDEHYHSTNGAIQESMHVYVESGFENISKKSISILEIGFGTGLNAYLTLLQNKTLNKKIEYFACELFPLASDIIEKLNYHQLLNENSNLFQILHTSKWEVNNEIEPNFSLIKKKTDIKLLNFLSFDNKFDLIYYDAFAPNKQPDMWSQAIFDYLFKATNVGGILVTYCAKGDVRRMLQQSGYSVERIPGPKGKREILRCVKKD